MKLHVKKHTCFSNCQVKEQKNLLTLTVSLIKTCDEDLEFEFERVVEKLDQQSVHCPKCNSSITKVVLRKKTRTIPVPPKSCNLFGCFSCFSIFIPKGITSALPSYLALVVFLLYSFLFFVFSETKNETK